MGALEIGVLATGLIGLATLLVKYFTRNSKERRESWRLAKDKELDKLRKEVDLRRKKRRQR